ncbi:uncharacterized protein MONOS_10898 [Monocercomonoides exilis]|uniref:uncharacterized protein n=1 Tax=Monocercomonoides exilis TaxID=2049356 RepID=UPI00355A8A0D|nr:hypothetical protein MONOS_10898 [Monocercomonoides exilis]|eukprot:MONOS_10898.1-p1 / transcript=MONOS_10898.1 / gene=MONOS_10898 / organism=Monocercomonoides_exilis_PA203 / gene_product=unspecified product / transcript_product=unspecified product / location=Mono_scaffold00516:22786-23411(+) / protein_length=190 / sequence_SO=supercontig / SO=protein_coding / is_pseudo=false
MEGDVHSSSALVIDHSVVFTVEAFFTQATAVNDIERFLRIVVPMASVVYENHVKSFLRELQTLRVICCGAVNNASLVCRFQPRCKSFCEAFCSAGGSAAFEACSIRENEVMEQADLCGDGCECVSINQRSRYVVIKLDDEVMWQVVVVNEVGKIVEMGVSVEGLKMEDMFLPPTAIALAIQNEEIEKGW